ncbi:MAG: hypothetical protein A2W93_04045 [Bacteroidetes bacterium GWF2_43_63]|nr:MAG: hypothetical protein A2W94_06170 [Bacteroidetes bacterium GWE2_42_42]OFY54353.1 MAG: hypothetical protein A2W93_04045 [Bacteroidetes bacterium GWF2_43_63]HBG69257.1 hypothetical protein [Bacteroidales bacterium]HCB61187.1 hypothetical protein [Bacteroidales bacterium]HCY24107.1 hypothetical protein [Bacteroidales bacterium]
MLICSLGLSANKCYKKCYLENRITVVNKLDKAIYVVPCYHFSDTTLNFTSKDVIIANRNSFLSMQKQKTGFRICLYVLKVNGKG